MVVFSVTIARERPQYFNQHLGFCLHQQQKEYLHFLSFSINQVIKTTAF